MWHSRYERVIPQLESYKQRLANKNVNPAGDSEDSSKLAILNIILPQVIAGTPLAEIEAKLEPEMLKKARKPGLRYKFGLKTENETFDGLWQSLKSADDQYTTWLIRAESIFERMGKGLLEEASKPSLPLTAFYAPLRELDIKKCLMEHSRNTSTLSISGALLPRDAEILKTLLRLSSGSTTSFILNSLNISAPGGFEALLNLLQELPRHFSSFESDTHFSHAQRLQLIKTASTQPHLTALGIFSRAAFSPYWRECQAEMQTYFSEYEIELKACTGVASLTWNPVVPPFEHSGLSGVEPKKIWVEGHKRLMEAIPSNILELKGFDFCLHGLTYAQIDLILPAFSPHIKRLHCTSPIGRFYISDPHIPRSGAGLHDFLGILQRYLKVDLYLSANAIQSAEAAGAGCLDYSIAHLEGFKYNIILAENPAKKDALHSSLVSYFQLNKRRAELGLTGFPELPPVLAAIVRTYGAAQHIYIGMPAYLLRKGATTEAKVELTKDAPPLLALTPPIPRSETASSSSTRPQDSVAMASSSSSSSSYSSVGLLLSSGDEKVEGRPPETASSSSTEASASLFPESSFPRTGRIRHGENWTLVNPHVAAGESKASSSSSSSSSGASSPSYPVRFVTNPI